MTSTDAEIAQRLRDEIDMLEKELASDDPDLENPDYASYTLDVLLNILGD